MPKGAFKERKVGEQEDRLSQILRGVPKIKIRDEAQRAQMEAERNAYALIGRVMAPAFGKHLKDLGANEGELGEIIQQIKPKYFKGCKIQYAYDKNQDIFSVKINLNNKPRILTARAGRNFMELSITDTSGNVREVLRQDGSTLSYERMK